MEEKIKASKHKEKVKKEIRKRIMIMIILVFIAAIGIYKLSTRGFNVRLENKEMFINENDKSNKMIKVNDVLYMDSSEIVNVEHNGMPEYKIITTVKKDGIPQNNNESNFGKGYKYVIINNKEIHVLINGKWHVFISE